MFAVINRNRKPMSEMNKIRNKQLHGLYEIISVMNVSSFIVIEFQLFPYALQVKVRNFANAKKGKFG